MTLKKMTNAEKCRRYRERKKAEVLQLLALNKEEVEPPEITLKKKKNAEKSRKYRELKKQQRMQELSATNNDPQMLVEIANSQQKSMFASSTLTRQIKLCQENLINFKEVIISGGELNGGHINNFQDIIANRFLNFRPIDVQLIVLPQFVRPLSHLHKHIQIISGVSGQVDQITHWICTYYDGNVINIYDSLNMKSLYPEMECFLNQLFPHKPQHKFHRVRQQPNKTDCGVYAIAFATSLLNNRDPSKENYDHPKMRSHLLDIFNTTELLPFPIEPSADALRKRVLKKVKFQHKGHSAAALHMRKVRAQKKLEAHQSLQNLQTRHEPKIPVQTKKEDLLVAIGADTPRDEDIVCSQCNQPIQGCRYTCIQCVDYNTCVGCEAASPHALHYVLRIPVPRPQVGVDDILERVKQELYRPLEKPIKSEVEIDTTSIKVEIKEEILDDPNDGYEIEEQNHGDPFISVTGIPVEVDVAQTALISNIVVNDSIKKVLAPNEICVEFEPNEHIESENIYDEDVCQNIKIEFNVEDEYEHVDNLSMNSYRSDSGG